MDKVASALQRCPHLRVVHVATYDPSTPDAKPSYIDNPNGQTHKVSLDHYRRESKKILQVFKEVLPGAEVGEPVPHGLLQAPISGFCFLTREGINRRRSVSIPVHVLHVLTFSMTAFIDFTEPIRQHILAHFPHFSTPPLEGLDSPLPPPPCEGVPLPHPQSRTITGQQNGNIWTDLGTLIPVSSISADPPVSKDTNRPSGPDSLTSTVSQIVPEIIDGVVSGEGLGSHLAFNEHSWSAELEVTELDDDEDMRSLSDRENRGSSVSPEFQKIDTPSNDDHPPTWHDLALSIAASLMLMMRNEVKTRLGYTTSAVSARHNSITNGSSSVAFHMCRVSQGINSWQRYGPCLLNPASAAYCTFALGVEYVKLVASYKKRDSQVCIALFIPWRLSYVCAQQTILRNAAIPSYLGPLPFQKVISLFPIFF